MSFITWWNLKIIFSILIFTFYIINQITIIILHPIKLVFLIFRIKYGLTEVLEQPGGGTSVLNVIQIMSVNKEHYWLMSTLLRPAARSRLQLSNEPRHDKTNKMGVRPAQAQISLGIRPDWSESSLCAQWVAKDPSFLHADSKDSDQTGRMPRLIWVFAGHTLILLVLSCCGSNVFSSRNGMQNYNASFIKGNCTENVNIAKCFHAWKL